MIAVRSSNPEYNRHVDRYLKLIRWAHRRWSEPDGAIVVSTRGEPTRYTRIADAAFARLVKATYWTNK